MTIQHKSTIIAVAAGLLALFTPGAWAQRVEKIDVTFSAPVKVPGEVLPAGTYIFEAVKDGRVTRIWSADGSHIYATLLTVPTEKFQPVEEATVTLGKTPEGELQRIDSWFFPGDPVGSQFIYPKEHSHKIANTIPTGVKDIAIAPEFVAVHAAHLGVHAAEAVVHAGKFLI